MDVFVDLEWMNRDRIGRGVSSLFAGRVVEELHALLADLNRSLLQL